MLSGLLNLCFQFSVWTGLIALLLAGLLLLVAVSRIIFQDSVTLARDSLLLELRDYLHIAVTATIFCLVVAVLLKVIGGDINAL